MVKDGGLCSHGISRGGVYVDMPLPISKEVASAIIAAAQANPETETVQGLARRFGVSNPTVGNYLRKAGVHLTHKRRFRPVYSLNENFFADIDSPVKAQILGFICADGCLAESEKRVAISVAQQDEAYLEEMNKAMEHTKPIHRFVIGMMKGPQTGRMYPAQVRCSLILGRAKIYGDLLKLGLCPRKTWVDLSLPPIRAELIRWFILGLFEGDGCITCSKKKTGSSVTLEWSVVASPTMLTQIAKYIEQHLAIPAPNLAKKRGIHELRYSAEESVVRLMEWLYSEPTGLRMERKYNKWMEAKATKDASRLGWTERQHRASHAKKHLPPMPVTPVTPS